MIEQQETLKSIVINNLRLSELNEGIKEANFKLHLIATKGEIHIDKTEKSPNTIKFRVIRKGE